MRSISVYMCHCHQIGKPFTHGDCCGTAFAINKDLVEKNNLHHEIMILIEHQNCASKGEIIIVVCFLGLFDLVLGFPLFGGLTFFVSPWFQQSLTQWPFWPQLWQLPLVALACLLLLDFFSFSSPLSAMPSEPACWDLKSSIICVIRASDVSIGKLALTAIMNVDHDFGNDINSVLRSPDPK